MAWSTLRAVLLYVKRAAIATLVWKYENLVRSDANISDTLQAASQCFCGNTAPAANLLNADSCNLPCAGNVSEYCGGLNRLNLYNAPPPPINTCKPVLSTGYGLLVNGGFEDGFNGWTPGIVSGTFTPSLDQTLEYEGCNAAYVGSSI